MNGKKLVVESDVHLLSLTYRQCILYYLYGL